MKRLFFFILAYCALAPLHAKILEAPHFKEVVPHVNADTLLILDIDDTLLIPVQMLGCDEWFRHRLAKHKASMSSQEALGKSLAEWEAVRHITKMEIVEKDTDSIIASLQSKGFTMIGLTTQGLALSTRTTQQLKENNIDLSLTSPNKESHYFTNQGLGVLFQNGILFTSGTSKGESLFTLCEKIKFMPKRIVFINDKGAHLEDLEESANKRGIEFIGLRYSYSDKRKSSFVPEIAEVQFTQSSFHRLLTDDEARDLLKTPLKKTIYK